MNIAGNVKTTSKILVLLSVLTTIFLSAGYSLGGLTGLVLGLVLASILNFGSYWFSDKIVLKIYGAEPLEGSEFKDLHSRVEKLSAEAGIPKPKLYQNSMNAPNAFATGRNPDKGVVCVTEGLLNQLDDDEIDAVIAHELAHIKNRDTFINAVVATIAGAISFIAEIAFWSSLFTDDDMGEVISMLVLIVITPIIALLIKTAISRSMEFRADSNAVKIHGNKEGLSSALKKINSKNKQYKSRKHVSKVQQTGSNLFIDNPFSSVSITRFFSTHPPLQKRLDNIESTEVV